MDESAGKDENQHQTRGAVRVSHCAKSSATRSAEEFFDPELEGLNELADPASGDQSIEPADATHWPVKASTVARVSKWRS